MALIEMSLLIEAASFACKGYLKWLAMEDKEELVQAWAISFVMN